MSDANDWYTVEEAARALQRSTRQVRRYADDGRIKTKRSTSGRVLFYVPDVTALRHELDIDESSPPPPPKPRVEVIQQQERLEFLAYIRERDKQLAELQTRMEQALIEAGRLRGKLESYNLLPEDVQALREELASVKAERDELRRRLEQAEEKKSFWKRLFGG
jgi:DNA repair exonuclease SbcCD ATPase subunit